MYTYRARYVHVQRKVCTCTEEGMYIYIERYVHVHKRNMYIYIEKYVHLHRREGHVLCLSLQRQRTKPLNIITNIC